MDCNILNDNNPGQGTNVTKISSLLHDELVSDTD